MQRRNRIWIVSLVFLVISIGFYSFNFFLKVDDPKILSYKVDAKKSELKFLWKDSNNEPFGSFNSVITYCKKTNSELVFATNGGMYLPDQSPQGLFIEEYIRKSELDTTNGYGNFYMKPNGVFYITKGSEAKVSSTSEFKMNNDIRFATQSGPMLLINSILHPAFKEGSKNVHIRNGVGILPDNSILFAMSKHPITFYDFANFFKQAGCLNALYLDGFVSRTYLPSKQWKQTDGAFGVIIAEIKPK